MNSYRKKSLHLGLEILLVCSLCLSFFLLFFPTIASLNQVPLESPQSTGMPIDEPGGGTPIYERKASKTNGLGEINITHFRINAEITAANYYSADTKNVRHSYDGLVINNTISPASGHMPSTSDLTKQVNITIRVNETVQWTYNSSTTQYLIGFIPYVQPATLYAILLNGTPVDTSFYFQNYTTSGSNRIYQFYFNFTAIFQNITEGDLRLKYVYDIPIPISLWEVKTVYTLPAGGWTAINPSPYQYISNGSPMILSQQFIYNVVFGKFNWNYNVSARYSIDLPDKETIYNVTLKTFGGASAIGVSNLVLNKSINHITTPFINVLNLTNLEVTFNANFTIQMLDTVTGIWCEDRLVEGLSLRERDYKITITEGPNELMMSYFGINDTTIYYPDLVSGSDTRIRSALDRYVDVANMNTSLGTPSGPSVTQYVDGISMLITNTIHNTPYILFKDEVDIITVRYQATRSLEITITDNIREPLDGVRVNIYYGSQMYGTRISNYHRFPLPAIASDNLGRITVYNVPVGDYTVEVLDSQGNPMENQTVSSLKDYKGNIVVTSYRHFPSVIIGFSVMSCILIGIGIVKFRREK